MGDDDKQYTITYNDDGTIGGIKEDTYPESITITLPSSEDFYDASDYTVSYGGSSDWASTWNTDDTWPSEYRITEMINLYPALKIQYEKFIEIYNMCKDDFKTRGLDDDVPF